MALDDFFRGDSVSIKVTVQDIDDLPINLVSPLSILTFTLKSSLTLSDAAAEIKIEDDRSDPNADPPNGISVFNILSESSVPGTSQDGTDIPAGDYFYGIQYSVTGSPPTVKTLETGKVTVKQDITLIAT